MDNLTPVVLVHGLWHGSWCWSPLAERLAADGVPSVAVDLDGHGLKSMSPQSRWSRPFDPAGYASEPAPSAAVTASSAAATLVEQIRRVGRLDLDCRVILSPLSRQRMLLLQPRAGTATADRLARLDALLPS